MTSDSVVADSTPDALANSGTPGTATRATLIRPGRAGSMASEKSATSTTPPESRIRNDTCSILMTGIRTTGGLKARADPFSPRIRLPGAPRQIDVRFQPTYHDLLQHRAQPAGRATAKGHSPAPPVPPSATESPSPRRR